MPVKINGSGSFTGLTEELGFEGDLIFSGTGNRIKADMSNATVANRLMFQIAFRTPLLF